MGQRPLLAFALAALIVIAWFLWPFASIAHDPIAAVLAAARAGLLLAVTLGTTNVVAGQVPGRHVHFLRGIVGFAIAWSISAGVGAGFALSELAGRPDEWQLLSLAAAVDAFWCALALCCYDLLTAHLRTRPSAD
jgi:hypothetical protein